MSDFRDPTTWRHVFPCRTSDAVGAPIFYLPYRIMRQEGRADSGTREVTITYVIPARYNGSNCLPILLNYLVPPVTTMSGTNNIIPVYNNATMPGDETLKARMVSWKAHTESKPTDPYLGDGWNLAGANTAEILPTYEQYIDVQVVYDNKTKKVDSTDPWSWLHVRANIAGEYISLNTQNCNWDSVTGPKVDTPLQGLNQIVPEIEWTVTWQHLLKEHFEKKLKPILDDAMGKVNEMPMPFFFDAPTWTILFVGYELREEGETEYGSFLQNPLELELKFLEKHIKHATALNATFGITVNHNVFFDSTTGKWRDLLINGRNVFADYDLNAIFPETSEEGQIE